MGTQPEARRTDPRARDLGSATPNGSRRHVMYPVAGKHVAIWAGELEFLQLLGSQPPDVLARNDIAALNLLCATELPGAEGLIVREHLNILGEWAAVIGRVTEQNYYRFRSDPAAFDHSEPYWRMLVLTTVLQQQYGITYDRDKIEHMDWANSRDLFLHGLLGPRRSGTCPSLPVLLVAIGRRLGYPLRLVLSPGHVFSRWDDPAGGVQINLECHGNGLVVRPDEYYHHYPVEWRPELFAEEDRLGPNRVYLRSLTPQEELASFLTLRGHVWESLGRYGEANASYNTAANLSPHNPAYGYYANETWRKMADPAYQPDERPKWKGKTVNRTGPTDR